MDISLIVFAAPIFSLLIGIESLFSIYTKRSLYKFNDSINNISSGILEEIALLPARGAILYAYYYLYTYYALINFSSNSIISWVLLWIGVDFCYYWFHRSSHRCTFLWIGHSVHHQSEHYNLSVALRQGYFQALTSWVFYLPLALLGFSPIMFVAMASLNTIYQFWIHTQTINKMGWFESIFNTPSHHRVHHGKNPQYIDKNYAGSLIIWDKLFGTFEPEVQPVEYGITEPLDSWNPFYANIKVIKDVLHYGKGFKNKVNVVRAFFMPPDWIIRKLESESAPVVKTTANLKITPSSKTYQLINLMLVFILYGYVSMTFNSHEPVSWLLGALILTTLLILGLVANGNTKIQVVEFVRVTFVIAILYLLGSNPMTIGAVGLLFLSVNYLIYNPNRLTTIGDLNSNQ